MDEGKLLLLDPLPEEPPAGYCVTQYTHWVTQHDLHQSTKQNMKCTNKEQQISIAILYTDNYLNMRLSSAIIAHLCSCAPVEPAHIGGMSEVGVDPTGDQHVALGLLILDNVVEV